MPSLPDAWTDIVIGIEVGTLTPADLNALAAKARALLNTVGPYHLYSTPVVEACVENGTHYLDVSVFLSPYVMFV